MMKHTDIVQGELYLSPDASAARLKEADAARKHRAEINKAYSQGQISRRDLVRLGLFTTGSLMVPVHGLNPFVKSAYASVPTGAPRSPLFGAQPFTQALLQFEEFDRNKNPLEAGSGCFPLSDADDLPSRACNERSIPCDPAFGGVGPCEGRPPGELWAHQRWDEFLPQVGVEGTQEGAKRNEKLGLDFKFHPLMPNQSPEHMWTFNGTIPPKLLMGRYGEPILFRHHNKLPGDVTKNGGFGRHTITTHNHNGHNGAENDGFHSAFFFPGQFYDYHWPIILAGHDSINTDASDPMACGPDDNGGTYNIPGDWHETMSTHWFHDHMFSFTAQNVYKGNAAMYNLYSGLDRGNEEINDGINLRLPSGSAKPWGNRDYDINLVLADKAWDKDGQLFFDIFDLDGFIGDVPTVNFQYKPYFEVERRKYRFRILNGAVSRFFKLALSDSSAMIQIGNDGNLLPHPVVLTQLDEQGIAERYDVVIDFSRYKIGQKIQLVNLCEHTDGKKPAADLSVAQALSGKSADPCVGAILEFRIARNPAKPDLSQVPNTMIPNPDLSQIPISRYRTFEFGRSGGSDAAPWTVKTDGGQGLAADAPIIAAQVQPGTREVWTLINGGGGWDHPVHIHFEEGQILGRNGSLANVPAWERGRKDVYRLRPSGSVTLTMQFREFAGTYMEHCHNTQHEDNAMLVRWDINGNLVPLPTPKPSPHGVEFISSANLPSAVIGTSAKQALGNLAPSITTTSSATAVKSTSSVSGSGSSSGSGKGSDGGSGSGKGSDGGSDSGKGGSSGSGSGKGGK
ncbi:MAG TPA: multicopper oxidase domain-containing protein [Terriglobales bacterium]